jgi:tRNA-modifying protein YgfZ
MYAQWNLTPLAHLGVLRARGRDALAFLQGQLSADLGKLSPGQSLLAGYHNPQGRVLALLRLLKDEAGGVIGVLPRELIPDTVKRLSGFVLRSKVELLDDSPAWRIEGLIGPDAAATGPTPPFARHLPETKGAVARLGGTLLARVDEARWLVVSPAAACAAERPAGLSDCAGADALLWRRLAVAHGQPEVYTATSGEFVAQMLNLDLLGAIAFDKGCYTGQEVIARAHYRGRVKRRLQRFRCVAPPPAPGAAGVLADGRSVRVVEIAPTENGGGYEFLAVAPLAMSPGEAGTVTLPLDASPLPLPYELPE